MGVIDNGFASAYKGNSSLLMGLGVVYAKIRVIKGDAVH
jgi:hypothetical protein